MRYLSDRPEPCPEVWLKTLKKQTDCIKIVYTESLNNELTVKLQRRLDFDLIKTKNVS